MYGTLVVNSWIGIHEDCDITYNVNRDDAFEFFQADALREFVKLGGKELTEMDAMAAKEEAEWDARERAKLGQVTEQLGVIPNVPEKSVWLDLPDTCRMHGEFTNDWAFTSCSTTATTG